MTNQYDEIKQLLSTSRNLKRLNEDILKEEEGRELTPQEQKTEEDNFRKAVSDRVKFGKIRIYDGGVVTKSGMDGRTNTRKNGVCIFIR